MINTNQLLVLILHILEKKEVIDFGERKRIIEYLSENPRRNQQRADMGDLIDDVLSLLD